LRFDDVVLGTFSFSKLGNLGQAGSGRLLGPLIAQNNTYVRYSTGFNKIEFDQIVRDKLHLLANQRNVTFANGALDVKAAWIDMSKVQNQDRYYTRIAWLYDPATQTCSRKLVGLVGLHIVQKTKSRPQWIWTSFEQVDNVPPGHGVAMPFNPGTGAKMPKRNPNRFPPTPVPPPPFPVERLTPINSRTMDTNRKYQAALQGKIWRFYQLVTTQWPVPVPPTAPIVDPQQPGTTNHTFPGLGAASSAYANTTMETFDQEDIEKSCMACHNDTNKETDFIFSLATRAIVSQRGGRAITKETPDAELSAPLRRLLKRLNKE
jgi:hypothetical protein